MKYMPDRKWFATGIVGLISWGLIVTGMKFGIEVDDETALSLAGALMMIVHYLIPPSMVDVAKRIDTNLKSLGG